MTQAAQRLPALLAVLAVALSIAIPARAAEPAAMPLDGGAFFALSTSAADETLGYSVSDDRGIGFWTAYQALGGRQSLGAPLSRRFAYVGAAAQLFERGLLSWDATSRSARLVNVFDDLAEAGLDALLLAEFGVVASATWASDAGLPWNEVRANHLTLLEGPESWRTALRDAYLNTPGAGGDPTRAIALLGLPMGIGASPGGYALRAQRAAFVYAPAVDDAPQRVSLPAVLQAAGRLPQEALAPHRPDQRPHLRPKRPVFAVHFFDWWQGPNLPSQFFTHAITWERIGLSPAQIGTAAYYDVNFRLIRELGADGVIWEWYEGANLTPSTTVLEALAANDLKIGIFYDWELINAGGKAVLSETSYIRPDEASLGKIAGEVVAFYQGIPRELWLWDADGRLPVVVYGYGFPKGLTDVPGWTWFFTELVRRVEAALDVEVVFDWSAAYLPPSQVQEFAFERWPEAYQPFNFVVDLPQPQFGSHVVTWNFIFDNRGVAQRDSLPRVIRDDIRYLQEPLWLAAHAAPSLVFLYSWNELYEGSHLLPDDTYGWRRYELAQAMIARVEADRADDLPLALVIVDPYDAYPDGTNGLFENQRLLLRHYLRRYVPQANTVRAELVTPEPLTGYDLIVSLTTDRRVDAALASLPERVRLVLWNATDPTTPLARRFVGAAVGPPPLGIFRLLDAGEMDTGLALTAEGDVLAVAAADGTGVHFYLDDNGRRYPLLVQAGNDFWVNLYAPNDALLAAVFERVYGRELEPAINFALGGRIQRLEVYPDGRVVQNTFQAPAVFRHEPLPVPDFTAEPPAGL